MKVKDPHEKIKKIRCACCGAPVMVDQWGQGACQVCHWYQGEDDLNPDWIPVVVYPNMVSLNRARQLYKEGKPLKPTMDEFIEAYRQYGEMELHYKGRDYGLITVGGEIKFYEWRVKGSTQSYGTIEDWRENANIAGALLKDIWDDIEGAGYITV